MQILIFMNNTWIKNFSNILWKFCLFEQHLQCNTGLQFFDYKQSSVPCTMVNIGMRIFESFARFWQDFVQESFLTFIIQTKSPSAFICLHFLFCLHFVSGFLWCLESPWKCLKPRRYVDVAFGFKIWVGRSVGSLVSQSVKWSIHGIQKTHNKKISIVL